MLSACSVGDVLFSRYLTYFNRACPLKPQAADKGIAVEEPTADVKPKRVVYMSKKHMQRKKSGQAEDLDAEERHKPHEVIAALVEFSTLH